MFGRKRHIYLNMQCHGSTSERRECVSDWLFANGGRQQCHHVRVYDGRLVDMVAVECVHGHVWLWLSIALHQLFPKSTISVASVQHERLCL
jgi:hypothetical protein